VNVYLDGEYAFAVTVLVATGLKKGQYLNQTEIQQLKNQDERDKAYNHAIHFLGFRQRTQKEMIQYLRGKGYLPQVVTETVDRLLQEHYLDDEAFACSWLENRERFRPRGQKALRYELKQKGISDEIIETVLTDLDEDKLAWAAVESKLNRWQNLEKVDFKKKVMGLLSRRGFSYEVARTVFDRAWASLNLSE
jgi:regulatory protein